MRTRSKLTYTQSVAVAINRETIIKKVFPELRKRGILAQANFLCCQSCAGYALAERATAKNKAGYVFWHRQDQESLDYDGHLYLAFTGADGCMNPPTAAVSTQVVGDMTARLLKEAGLTVEWDGTANTRILVDLTVNYKVGEQIAMKF